MGRKNIIEFPAGLIGDQEGIVEDIESAAKRELMEETGLKVKEVLKTTVADSSVSSSGIATEKAASFTSNAISKTVPLSWKQTDKKVVAVEKDQVKQWLEHTAFQGFAIDASVLAALYAVPDQEQLGQTFKETVLHDADKN